MIKRGKKYCKLSELKVNIGEAKLLLNQTISKILNVKTYTKFFKFRGKKYCKLSELKVNRIICLVIQKLI